MRIIVTALLILAPHSDLAASGNHPPLNDDPNLAVCTVLLAGINNQISFVSFSGLKDVVAGSLRPALVDIFVQADSSGSLRFNSAYEGQRREILLQFFNKQLKDVSEFDFSSFNALPAQIEAAMDERDYAHASFLAKIAEIADFRTSNPNVVRLSSVNETLDLEATHGQRPASSRREESERKQRIEALQREKAELLRDASVVEAIRRHEILIQEERLLDAERAGKQSQVYRLRDGRTYMQARMPTQAAVLISQNPPTPDMSVLDYIQHLIKMGNAAGLEDATLRILHQIVSTSKELTGLLVAEIRINYQREFQALVDTLEIKRMAELQFEIERLGREIATLKAAQTPGVTLEELNGANAELNSKIEATNQKQEEIQKIIIQLNRRISYRVGWFALAVVELILHWPF